MRRSVHFILSVIGLILWGTANFLYSACIVLSLIADRLIQNSTWGNCWTFVLARWWKYGGYIAVRKSDGNGFLGFLPLPHVLWVKSAAWSHAEIEHFIPKRRKRSSWFPWYAIYFDGKISITEHAHNAEVTNG